MANNTFQFSNSKIVWQTQQINLKPSPGKTKLTATQTFDFKLPKGAIEMFCFGLSGIEFTITDYIKTFSLQPRVISIGPSSITVKINGEISNLNGQIDFPPNPWVKLTVFAFIETNSPNGALLTNVSNISNTQIVNAGNNRLTSGAFNAYTMLSGFSFSDGDSPYEIDRPTIVSMNADMGVEMPVSNAGTSNFSLTSDAVMLNADTAYYGKLQTQRHTGIVSAGLMAFDNTLDDTGPNPVSPTDNSSYIIRAQTLHFNEKTPKDKEGNFVLNMPDFGVDLNKYAIVDYTTVFQNFQASKQDGNLYGFKNQQFGLNTWITSGTPRQVVLYSYFALISENVGADGKPVIVANTASADILVIAVFKTNPS